MLMRFLPLIGGLLMSRGVRRGAGRHAGKLTLALGAWELWRAYQASQQNKPVTPGKAPPPGRANHRTVRPVTKRKRFL